MPKEKKTTEKKPKATTKKPRKAIVKYKIPFVVLVHYTDGNDKAQYQITRLHYAHQVAEDLTAKGMKDVAIPYLDYARANDFELYDLILKKIEEFRKIDEDSLKIQ